MKNFPHDKASDLVLEFMQGLLEIYDEAYCISTVLLWRKLRPKEATHVFK